MPRKPDLSEIALAGGSRRTARTAQAEKQEKPATQPSREGTSPITVHFPRAVRDQIKIAAIKRGIPMNRLIAEWFNDGFAKEGMPEICPTDGE
jgi:hypothetical protein